MAAATTSLVFSGTVVHSLGVDDVRILPDMLLGVSGEGKVLFLESKDNLSKITSQYSFEAESVRCLTDSQFIMPGMVDSHIHGAQIRNGGKGYDRTLLQWLEKYTYPEEARFQDVEFARHAYDRAVSQTLFNGTTTACYFASIHNQGSMVLCDVVEKFGQRAYVGKVSMDSNAPDFYSETTDEAIANATSFVEAVIARKSPLVTPVITPRFAPSCSATLMAALGKLAAKHDLPIQSHLSENSGEIAWVKELFPECPNYTSVYDKFGLLTNKTVMAHCIYLSDEEAELMHTRGAGISHCAASNFDIVSGVMKMRKLLGHKIKIGLGTDVSGGHSASILDAARHAILASNIIHMEDRSVPGLTYKEAFHLATLGGTEALALDDVVGNFIPGKHFDALLIDLAAPGSQVLPTKDDTLEDLLSKFIFLGDDRNVSQVYVAGVERKQSFVSGRQKEILTSSI